jgi:hypothetical protein
MGGSLGRGLLDTLKVERRQAKPTFCINDGALDAFRAAPHKAPEIVP